MTIDVRATVTCSIGTLVSGNLSDSYVQGEGLIRTTGSVVLSGVYTPAVGTAVTFSYTTPTGSGTIPRRVRVLSSFADPYRRTTTVELGCLLTYLANKRPAVPYGAKDDPENAGLSDDDAKIITLPIYAASVAAQCLTELGLSAVGLALTNRFSVEEFDLSGGYVSVLGGLLSSEGYLGYLDEDEVLQCVFLDVEGGTGPVLDKARLIDLGPIGQGQLPGDAVTVSYSSLRLRVPDGEEKEEPAEEEKERRNWEREEFNGDTQEILVSNPLFDANPTPDPQPRDIAFKYKPSSVTRTEYDAFDRVTKRVTTTKTILAEIAPSALSAMIKVERDTRNAKALGSIPYQTVTTTTYEYKMAAKARPSGTDEKAREWPPQGYEEVKSETVIVEEPVAKLAASTPVYDLWAQNGLMYDIPLAADTYVSEKTVTTYETSFDHQGAQVTKTLTARYQAHGLTIRGQQALAQTFNGETQIFVDGESNGVSEAALVKAQRLNHQGTDIQIAVGREIGLQKRPSAAARNNAADAEDGASADNGFRVESRGELEFAIGSAASQNRVEFTLPYAPDDTFIKVGSVYRAVGGGAKVKALRYGRIQNRLLLGNRSGMNVQTGVGVLPSAPFAPFVVQANGLSALYRTNGMSWTFSPEGIVVSTDALFWGAVGGTGAFWFPVAPGITTLPTTPPVVGGEMTVGNVVPVWTETVPLQGRLRLRARVESLPYALTLPDVEVEGRVRLRGSVARLVTVNLPLSTLSLSAPEPLVYSPMEVNLPLSTLSLSAAAPDILGSTVVQLPLSTLSLSAATPAVTSGLLSDPTFSNVALLLPFNGTNGSTTFTDASSNALTVTANGNAQISTAQSVFGGASGLFDGNNDYLTVTSSNFNFGTGDFAIQGRVRRAGDTATGAGSSQIILDARTAEPSTQINLFIANSSASYALTFYVNGASRITGNTVPLNTWVEWSLLRVAGVTRLYMDGTQVGGNYTDANNYSATAWTIGGRFAAVSGDFRSLNGYLDNMRIVKGQGLFAGTSYTVATTPFPTA